MRYLLFINIAVWLLACSGPYKTLRKSKGDAGCLQPLKPSFSAVLYNTKVNVTGKHLSGLLIIKTMPDSSIRLVFSNEAGFKFFDFGFSGNEFRVYYIYKEMDKKPVIKTLRKDFQLVLMNSLDFRAGYLLRDDLYNYYSFTQGKDHYYYITDSLCHELVRMERGTRLRPVLTAIAENFTGGIPDTIGITHSNFNFDIGLKRIYNYAEK